jgi:RNA polymerase sigma-70 factor (ECF subfamily)
LQFYRRQKKRPAQPFCNLDAFASSCESQHHSLVRTEESDAVRRAIVGLPAKYRQVLVLREFEHRSTKETAQSLRSTIPTVKTRVHRARIMLLSALRREGIGSC